MSGVPIGVRILVLALAWALVIDVVWVWHSRRMRREAERGTAETLRIIRELREHPPDEL